MQIFDAFADFFELIRGQLVNIEPTNLAGQVYVVLNLALQVVATFLGGLGENFSILNLFGGRGL